MSRQRTLPVTASGVSSPAYLKWRDPNSSCNFPWEVQPLYIDGDRIVHRTAPIGWKTHGQNRLVGPQWSFRRHPNGKLIRLRRQQHGLSFLIFNRYEYILKRRRLSLYRNCQGLTCVARRAVRG